MAHPARSRLRRHLARRGLNLPSGALLTKDEVDYVCSALVQSLDVLTARP